MSTCATKAEGRSCSSGSRGIRARAVANEGRGSIVDADGILVKSVPAGDAGADETGLVLAGVGGSGLRGGCRLR